MKDRHHHLAQVGTFEMKFYGRDDRYVKRVVARWLTLCWEKAKARQRELYPGSMAVAIDDGWHDSPPTVRIGRWRMLSGDVIPCTKAAIIEKFPAEPEAIREFCRVFDKRPRF